MSATAKDPRLGDVATIPLFGERHGDVGSKLTNGPGIELPEARSQRSEIGDCTKVSRVYYAFILSRQILSF